MLARYSAWLHFKGFISMVTSKKCHFYFPQRRLNWARSITLWESNRRFCCRWAFPTRAMTQLSGTEDTKRVPLSTVILRVGNAHLQQNPILDSFSCTTPQKNYLSQLKRIETHLVCLCKIIKVRTEFLYQAKTTNFLSGVQEKSFQTIRWFFQASTTYF